MPKLEMIYLIDKFEHASFYLAKFIKPKKIATIYNKLGIEKGSVGKAR